jgi:hypothetical protein
MPAARPDVARHRLGRRRHRVRRETGRQPAFRTQSVTADATEDRWEGRRGWLAGADSSRGERRRRSPARQGAAHPIGPLRRWPCRRGYERSSCDAPRRPVSSKRVHEPQPCDLTHVVLDVDQELGEPPRIVPGVQPTDQRCPVGGRPLEHVEELAGGLRRRAPRRCVRLHRRRSCSLRR